MEKSKLLVGQALTTIQDNMKRTGDPLGFKSAYWTEWANGLDFPPKGPTILLTARMYQMLPYITQLTQMIASAKGLLVGKSMGKLMNIGSRIAGETIIKFKAKGADDDIKEKGTCILRGITAALRAAGEKPAFLGENEPYSGALLYDLGLDDDASSHAKNVQKTFAEQGVQRVIAVDPHTALMLKEIYPQFVNGFGVQVRHYLEILAEQPSVLAKGSRANLPKELVLHDSCVMTRDLGFVEQARAVAAGLGIKVLEPENTKVNTACCGGPIEYAFGDLSDKVSTIRIKELAGVGKNILTTCPICLINLRKYEKELGLRVWDMGEILFSAFGSKAS
jgi:Fe-S oxidoreductase